MSPQAIVQAAISRGVDLIAVTDHNTAAMVEVVGRAAQAAGLHFLYGMELQTREEVHVLAYFDRAADCLACAETIYSLLPDMPNVPDVFGDQVAVALDGTILHTEPKLLVNSLDLSFGETLDCIRSFDGLPVPAHIDRASYGVLAQLGVFPENTGCQLVESDGALPPALQNMTRVCFSDAHHPDQVGEVQTEFRLEEASVAELQVAARGEAGRSVKCLGE